MIPATELRIGNKIRYSLHELTVSQIRNIGGGYVVTKEGIDGYLQEYDGICWIELIGKYQSTIMGAHNKGVYFEKEDVENNPEWFKKKEKPKVTCCNYNDENCNFYLDNKVTTIEVGKERLAEILIAESNGELFIDTREDRMKRNADSGRKYTEEELLDFGDTCFKAAREKDHLRQPGLLIPPDRYYDFADFKISYLLKKKNGNKH